MATTNIDTTHLRTSTSSAKKVEDIFSIPTGVSNLEYFNSDKNIIFLVQDSNLTLTPESKELFQEDFTLTIRQSGAVPPAAFTVVVNSKTYALDVDVTISVVNGEVIVAGNLQP